MTHYQIIIIGSGPAGYTAAIYASRAQLKVLMLEGSQPGGQLTITSEVENYPGFSEGVDGFTLMEEFKKQAIKFGTTVKSETVNSVIFKENQHIIKTNSESYTASSVIISTGASARWLGLESEKKLMNKGISACATCDGFFFRGKEIAVIGGGDSAMEEATFLTRFATKVTLIHRKNTFRASKIMLTRAQNNPKIEFKTPFQVVDILGQDEVTGIKIKNCQDQTEEIINLQGVFMAIGHVPNTQIFNSTNLSKDEQGYIITKPGTSLTNIAGVFACGDVQDKHYRQAVTAAGSGCMAALDAENYLLTMAESPKKDSTKQDSKQDSTKEDSKQDSTKEDSKQDSTKQDSKKEDQSNDWGTYFTLHECL